MTRSRLCAAIVPGALACSVALAQSGSEIEWTAARPLHWEDFRGPVPAGTEEQRVAATAGSLAWSYEYTIHWSGDECRFRIDRIDSHALFHPDTSWVRPDHRNDSVLQHEQGHFDILQVYKTRFDTDTRGFLGEMRPCRGRTERRAARDTRDAIDRLVGPVYDETWQQYRNRQATYDRETRHGIDTAAQDRWSRDIALELHEAAAN